MVSRGNNLLPPLASLAVGRFDPQNGFRMLADD